MWLEPLNANQTTYKSYYGHTPTPVNMIVSYKKQKEIVQSLLTDRDILVREEVKNGYMLEKDLGLTEANVALDLSRRCANIRGSFSEVR